MVVVSNKSVFLLIAAKDVGHSLLEEEMDSVEFGRGLCIGPSSAANQHVLPVPLQQDQEDQPKKRDHEDAEQAGGRENHCSKTGCSQETPQANGLRISLGFKPTN